MTESTGPLGRDAVEGMLLSHVEDGEDVGLPVRHVERSADGSKVLVVLEGAEVRWYRPDESLDVVDEGAAERAQARLRERRRRAKQVADLRAIAEMIESSGLAMPRYLRVEGSLESREDFAAAAAAFGGGATRETSGGAVVFEFLFSDDPEHMRYAAPVQLSLTHYPRDTRPAPQPEGGESS